MKINNLLIIFAISIAIGCKNSKSTLSNKFITKDSLLINPPYLRTPTAGNNDLFRKYNYTRITTFYATDRNVTRKGSGTYYGGDRSTSPISYGTCQVSIPRSHNIGSFESPSIYNLEIDENPNKHITILSINPKSKSTYFSEIRTKIKESESNALIFIHGYSVGFGEAARRTAQICYDLNFKGVPIFYSWPSKGDDGLISKIKYTVDESNNQWSENNIKSFLIDFISHSEAENIFLFGHSMGNRCLTNALVKIIKERPEFKNRFKEIILTAPDIDLDIFKRDIAPTIVGISKRITLYVSSTDEALQLSKKVHGTRRVGEAGKDIPILKQIETIDASGIVTDDYGHSYSMNSKSVLDDIFYLINNSLGADRRNLIKENTKFGSYWIIRK